MSGFEGYAQNEFTPHYASPLEVSKCLARLKVTFEIFGKLKYDFSRAITFYCAINMVGTRSGYFFFRFNSLLL